MKPFAIVNPAAGSVGNLNNILEELRRLDCSKVCVTRRKGEAEIIAQKAMRSGCKFIVVAGGDGTLNEVVNAIARSRHARRTRVGLVPLGTGNDFARSLGLPIAIPDSIEILRGGRTAALDLVRVKSDRVRYFANVSSGGFSGAVDERITPQIKRTWGPLAYVRGAAAALPKLHGYRTEIVFDDKEKFSLNLYNVIVANGRFVAGGLPIAPDSSLCDGLLDAVLIPACPTGELALLAGQILLGKHLKNDTVIFRRAAKISLKSLPKMRFNVDGEPVGSTPIVFQVVPNALNFLTKK